MVSNVNRENETSIQSPSREAKIEIKNESGATATRSRGLGDSIAKITRWFGIEPCGGCQKRKELLNQWFPYRAAVAEVENHRITAATQDDSNAHSGGESTRDHEPVPPTSAEDISELKRPQQNRVTRNIRTTIQPIVDESLWTPENLWLPSTGRELYRYRDAWLAGDIPFLVRKLGLRQGIFPQILASTGGGGWREPDRRIGGPFDWEGGRRQRRGDGQNPAPNPGAPGAPTSFACGIDVTSSTKGAIRTTKSAFGGLSNDDKHQACKALNGLTTGEYAWDIIELHSQVTSDSLNKPFRPTCATSGANPPCGSSVRLDGSCHFAGSANYVIFGIMCRLCYDYYEEALNSASWYEIFDKDAYRKGMADFNQNGMLWLIDLYKKYVPILTGDSPARNIEAAKRWSIAGWNGWPYRAATPQPDRANCTLTCPQSATAPFTVSWYPFLNPYSGR